MARTQTAKPIHDACKLFPLIEGDLFNQFCADIKLHGLLEPIQVLDGAILDGRNRYRACQETGIKPQFVDIDLNGLSPIAYVLSRNFRRRDLSSNQRAMIAASAKALELDMRAKQKTTRGTPVKASTAVDGEGGDTSQQHAEVAGVSRAALFQAQTVLEDGSSVTQEAVRSNTLPLAKAKILSELDKLDQNRIVAKGPKAIDTAIKNIQAKKKKERDNAKAQQESQDAEENPPTVSEMMKLANSALEKAAKSFTDSFDNLPDNAYINADLKTTIRSQLKAIAGEIRSAKGYATCCYCSGDGCDHCRHTGYLRRIDYESAPANLKK